MTADANKYAVALAASDVVARFERVGNANAALEGWGRGRRLVGMTMGQFSMIDLIRAVLERTGPAALRLSTWTIGLRDAHAAAFLLSRGAVTSLQLMIDRSFAVRQPAYCAAVRHLFGDDAIRATYTHAKIALITADGWNVAIRGSMNLNKNPRFENFDIDDDPAVAGMFHRHLDLLSEVMPAGPVVPQSDVEILFKRIRAGLNPLDDDADPGPAVPLDELRAWVLRSFAAARRRRVGLRTVPALAKRCSMTPGAVNRALTSPDPAFRDRVVAIVVKCNGRPS